MAARGEHAAFLLNTGKVLLVGGGLGNATGKVEAELYDPVSQTFAATGSMLEGRGFGLYGGAAAPLASGRLLVAGGFYANSSFYPISMDTAEIYSPVTGTFAATGKMTASRSGHTATLLTNRRVLIAGGRWTEQGAAATALDTAELYDEDSGVFTLTGAMPEPRFNHTATVLVDGRVLLAGGFTYPPTSWVARAAVYDPATGTFARTGVMVTPRVGHKATLLPDGKVLLTGGQGSPTQSSTYVFLSSAEIFDPETGLFSPAASMPQTRLWHTQTPLGDGLVLITGGGSAPGTATPDAVIYSP